MICIHNGGLRSHFGSKHLALKLAQLAPRLRGAPRRAPRLVGFYRRAAEPPLGVVAAMFGRSIAKEFTAASADPSTNARDALPVVPSRKRAKEEPPEVITMDQIRAACEDAKHSELDRVIVVTVTDEFSNSTLQSADKKLIGQLSLCPGPLFDTHVCMGGFTIWKSSCIPDGHDKPMYFFCHDGGWYLADQIFLTEKEEKALKANVALWVEGDGSDIPRKPHFPYWAKKACKEIQVMSVFDYCMDLDEHGHTPKGTTAEMNDLKAELAQLREEYDILAEDNAGLLEQIEGLGGECKPAGRGGWLPRVGRLLTSIYRSDWNYMYKLAAEFRQNSHVLDGLVEHKLVKSGGKGTGKGFGGQLKGKGGKSSSSTGR